MNFADAGRINAVIFHMKNAVHLERMSQVRLLCDTLVKLLKRQQKRERRHWHQTATVDRGLQSESEERHQYW